MTIDKLKQQLNNGTLNSFYYLAGDEQYLLDYYYDRFKDVCAGALPEFNFIELDGKKLDFDMLADASSSYPVMAEKKLIAVIDADAAAVKGSGEKKLVAALEDIAPGVTVLFWEHAREKGKANAVEAAVKKCGGEVVRADKPKAEALIPWAQSIFAKAEIDISTQNCALLIELTGGSMLRLDNEIKKLIAYVGNGEVDRNAIEKMVTPAEDASWFAISNAIGEHDFDLLMQALQSLYSQNVDESVIAGMFYRAYIDLWRGDIALREGKSSAELATVCAISPYAAARIMRTASKLEEGEALDGLRKCLELDQKLKTSGLNKRDLIYSFAAGLLAFKMKDHE